MRVGLRAQKYQVFERVREAIVGVVPCLTRTRVCTCTRTCPGTGSSVGFGGEQNVEGANWFVRRDDEAAEGGARGAVREDAVFGRGGQEGEEGGAADDPVGVALGACLGGRGGGGGGCHG